MNKIDLEHKLLKGSPINFCGIPLYHTTIGEMVDFEYGYSVFNQILGLCVLEKSKFNTMALDNGETIEGSAFWYFYFNVINELKTQQPLFDYDGEKVFLYHILVSFFSTLFHKEVVFNADNGFIIGQDKPIVLNDSNFDKFVELLKIRFGMLDTKELEDEDNPADERTRMLLEKRKKLREKVKKSKQNDDDDGLQLTDLISIFAEAENISPLYVYENYDMYQFNNQFNRLKIMEDYQTNIRALLAGAKSEDINLQHWLSKIKKQET